MSATSNRRSAASRLRAAKVERALETFRYQYKLDSPREGLQARHGALGYAMWAHCHAGTPTATIAAIYRALEAAADLIRGDWMVEYYTRRARDRFAELDRADRERGAA